MLPAILASRAALGVPDPFGTLAAFFISAEQGGVFMMNVKDLRRGEPAERAAAARRRRRGTGAHLSS